MKNDVSTTTLLEGDVVIPSGPNGGGFLYRDDKPLGGVVVSQLRSLGSTAMYRELTPSEIKIANRLYQEEL